MCLIMLVGLLVFARFVPPPSPALDAHAVSDIYGSHTNSIRFGAPAHHDRGCAARTVRRRGNRADAAHEGRVPVAFIQLALGALIIIEFILPLFLAQTAAFRAQRSPRSSRRSTTRAG